MLAFRLGDRVDWSIGGHGKCISWRAHTIFWEFNVTTDNDELTVDLGDVGYRNSLEPFRVRLNSSALTALIEASAEACRVYELYLIDRPGDVWDYVSVVADAVPVRVTGGIQSRREKLKSPYRDEYPWEEDRVPFTVFDSMFYWAGDDTEPADTAWLNHRDSKEMRNYATQLLGMVRTAQGRLDSNDDLLCHIVDTIKAGTHPYSFLERKAAVAKSATQKPTAPEHSDAFYNKLRDLLRDPELASIAYRGNGDHQLLRMLATEQRRRASETQHLPGHAMYISALVNHQTNNLAWGSEIWFYDEGLGHGDLYIQGVGQVGGASIKELVEVHHRITPGRYILSNKDEGDISDCEKVAGDGWVLYTKRNPFDRRTGLDYTESRRSRKLGPILAFAEFGQTLFDFDKTLIVVGEDIPVRAREALAAPLIEWEAKGGDPVLIVFGDSGPFKRAGCRRVFTPPDAGMAEPDKVSWLSDLLRVARPWIDVILSLDAPRWLDVELSSRAERTDLAWQPWVVCSKATHELKTSLLIDGDLDTLLRAAHVRAKSHR